MKHVCYFRHALALDEKRVKFLPEYAHGGTSLPPTIAGEKDYASHGGNVEPEVELGAQYAAVNLDMMGSHRGSKESTRELPHTKEVWFAGTHSDM